VKIAISIRLKGLLGVVKRQVLNCIGKYFCHTFGKVWGRWSRTLWNAGI